MLPRSLKVSLLLVELAAFATLLRSVAYDRWITVFASVLLLLGAAAARRGKSWGIALGFATAVAFPVAALIGIAPGWFNLVGMLGVLPFAFTWRAFARADKGATALLAGLAAAGGTLVALAWQAFAWSVFHGLPVLHPSAHANHGLLVATLLVLGIVVGGSRLRGRNAERTRIGTAERGTTRIAEMGRSDEASEMEALAEHEGRSARRVRI